MTVLTLIKEKKIWLKNYTIIIFCAHNDLEGNPIWGYFHTKLIMLAKKNCTLHMAVIQPANGTGHTI